MTKDEINKIRDTLGVKQSTDDNNITEFERKPSKFIIEGVRGVIFQLMMTGIMTIILAIFTKHSINTSLLIFVNIVSIVAFGGAVTMTGLSGRKNEYNETLPMYVGALVSAFILMIICLAISHR